MNAFSKFKIHNMTNLHKISLWPLHDSSKPSEV